MKKLINTVIIAVWVIVVAGACYLGVTITPEPDHHDFGPRGGQHP
jgi:hypothetical protein